MVLFLAVLQQAVFWIWSRCRSAWPLVSLLPLHFAQVFQASVAGTRFSLAVNILEKLICE